MRTFLRFFMLLLAFGLLPVGGALLQFARSNVVVRENARSFHTQIARLAAESAERAASEMNRSLGFAEEIAQGRLPSAGEAAVLQRAVSSNSNLLMAALHAADGRRTLRLADERLFPLEPDEDAVWDPLSARALTSGRVTLGAVRAKRGRPYVPVAYPLPDGRLVRAACGLEELQRRLKGLRGGPSGRVVLADADGASLAGFGAEMLGRPPYSPDEGRHSGATAPLGPGRRLARSEDPQGWLDAVPGADETLVGAWAEAPSLGWTAWSLQPRSEAFALGEHAGRTALAMFLLLAALVAAAALWIARRVGTPLGHLVTGAARTSEGRFDVQLVEEGWGEFRQVQRAFNAMMRSLEAYQRMQVERQLQDKAKLESIVRTVPSGLVLSDAGGKILYINSSARVVLGEAGATMPGGWSLEAVLREPGLRGLVDEVVLGGKRAHASEVALDCGGKRRVFFCQARAVESAKRLVAVLLVMHDVTSERELEALKERFLHAVVHDLRGPIGTISGFIDIMASRGEIPESGRKRMDYVNSSVRQMKQLVDNILDSAKLKAGGMRLRLEPVEARELLDEVRGIFALQAETRRIALRVEAPPDVGAAVLCDRRLLGRAIGNLVGNALKFTPSGGSVTVRAVPYADNAPGTAREETGRRAVRDGAGTEFSVQDTGHGIPADKLGDVFKPFEQIDSMDASKHGFGLGLSLVKEWVELHGGRIRVESVEGKGTRFTFRIPAREAAPGGAEPRRAGLHGGHEDARPDGRTPPPGRGEAA